MQILMQIENAVCVSYLINTPFVAHYPYSVLLCFAMLHATMAAAKIALKWYGKPLLFPFNKNIECYVHEEFFQDKRIKKYTSMEKWKSNN